MDPINVNLNIYQTLAAATAVYYVGVLLRIKVPFRRHHLRDTQRYPLHERYLDV